MKTQTTQNIVIGTVLAGFLGFSSTGFAQANAVEALNQNRDQADRELVQTSSDHAAVDRLAAAVDEHNGEATQGLVPETRIPADQAQPEVAEVTRSLSAQINAYNNTDNPSLNTRIPAGQTADPVAPVIGELSARLEAYNQTGGLQTL